MVRVLRHLLEVKNRIDCLRVLILDTFCEQLANVEVCFHVLRVLLDHCLKVRQGLLMVTFVVPGKSPFHVALKVQLFEICLAFLEWEQFDSFSVRLCRSFVILESFVAITDAKMPTKCVFVQFQVRFKIA